MHELIKLLRALPSDSKIEISTGEALDRIHIGCAYTNLNGVPQSRSVGVDIGKGKASVNMGQAIKRLREELFQPFPGQAEREAFEAEQASNGDQAND